MTWKDDRENVERLNAVKGFPNPSVEEIKDYRERHPEKSVAEAVADLKEGVQR